ncbi:MAG: hypothetical protein Q4C73_01015 [Eubacteriales bacterium]|nr:hypothetical protein [Eubacteriales bacterium]
MKKRKVFACAVLAAGVSVGAYGTYALYEARIPVTNVITSGNVKIAVRETMKLPGRDTELPFKDQKGVVPGQRLSKIVRIKNTGRQPAYVRVKVETNIALRDGTQGKPDLSLISCDINESEWREKDGFYYYKVPLEAGSTTAPLFTEVFFHNEIGNLYQESEVKIGISAQAVQTAHNGDDALTARGWTDR